MATRPALADLYLGQTLGGRFAIQDYLNCGGFSLVFLASDAASGLDVAIKVLAPGASAGDRLEFDTECELLERTAHCGHVIDRITDGNDTVSVQVPATGVIVPLPTRYLVLERAQGSLAELLTVRDRISWPDRLALFRGAVKGVHQMHLARIAHRDTKADNILLTETAAGQVVAKVADLGRSQLVSRTPRFADDSYRMGRGDLRFAPPEYLFGLAEARGSGWAYADLYYLGSLFFEIATGQGLTTASLGDVRGLTGHTSGLTLDQRRREFAARRYDLATRYESSYQQFAAELPRSIRLEADRLLRQLSSVEASRRCAQRYGRHALNPSDLQWIFRRIDIMSLALTVRGSGAYRRAKAG
jgi:serine/threonine protein kinase